MAQDRSFRSFDLWITDPYETFESSEMLNADVEAVTGIHVTSRGGRKEPNVPEFAGRRDLVNSAATVGFRLDNKELYDDDTAANFFFCGGATAPKDKFFIIQDRNGNEQPQPVGNRQLVIRYTNAPEAAKKWEAAARAAWDEMVRLGFYANTTGVKSKEQISLEATIATGPLKFVPYRVVVTLAVLLKKV